MAYPKQHLIALGFRDDYFGIEVKHLDPGEGFSQKASRALWQTVSYTDSEFFVQGTRARLKFAVLFSGMSFEKEVKLLNHLGQTFENDWALWHGLRQLANHANVGTLEIKGDRDAWTGWKIAFAGGRYFTRSHFDKECSYRLSNPRMVEKNRIDRKSVV